MAARRAHGTYGGDATVTTTLASPAAQLFVGPGIGTAGDASRFFSADLLPGGELTAFTKAFNGAVGRAGYGAAAASNQLFLFGGGSGAAPNDGRDSGLLAGGGQLNNVNATGGVMTVPRAFPATTLGSGRLFILGGETGSGPTATVESSIW